MQDLERRIGALSDPRVGAESSRGPRLMSGRAIVYGSASEDLGGFVEIFKPGSVQLAPDLVVLFSHDTSMVLGRTGAGTARAFDDGRGVVFEVEPPDTQWARDLAVSMDRGDIRSCSFAFRALDEYWYYDEVLGTAVREVLSAIVSELSVIAMPAYPATEAVVN
jgi:uncharacterized protein